MIHDRLTRRGLAETRLRRREVPSATRLSDAMLTRQSGEAGAPSLVTSHAIGVHQVARLHLFQCKIEVIRYQQLILGKDEGVKLDLVDGRERVRTEAGDRGRFRPVLQPIRAVVVGVETIPLRPQRR